MILNWCFSHQFSIDVYDLLTRILLGLALLTLSWDKNWDSHSWVNGYPSFYPRIALVAPSPGVFQSYDYPSAIEEPLTDMGKTTPHHNMINPLQWRHNKRDWVSNHQTHDCVLNRLCRGRSKKTWKLRITGLCEGNSPETGEFPAQRASNGENVFIWWRHHAKIMCIIHGMNDDHHNVNLRYGDVSIIYI